MIYLKIDNPEMDLENEIALNYPPAYRYYDDKGDLIIACDNYIADKFTGVHTLMIKLKYTQIALNINVDRDCDNLIRYKG